MRHCDKHEIEPGKGNENILEVCALVGQAHHLSPYLLVSVLTISSLPCATRYQRLGLLNRLKLLNREPIVFPNDVRMRDVELIHFRNRSTDFSLASWNSSPEATLSA